ncbi:hypothetical protein A33Q_1157 [Indibacter alkaliphilus LW1]|uniref:Uncharacterized protein n=1 Tax=Indibacter alkaliphilus (strain CCUG 57479 / KCTC 22604 / LW1) TaxID=1189612 RepID=S2E890_INDAL|nr:DUF6252 family protein [Indibacter alkaliphilus]EOZ98503.1 hypothetical protein A33Q_1157 [Indibacter alkaliphilus LW1]
MKKLKSLILLALFAGSFLFVSCENDDTPNGAMNVEAKIDGTDWKGSGNSQVVGVAGITTTSIAAGATNRSAISITIMDDKAGTYDLANVASYTDQNQTVYMANSGTLTISKFEGNKISGTFSFTARPALGSGNNISITEGKFTDVNVSR